MLWDWDRPDPRAICHVPTQKERIFASRCDPFAAAAAAAAEAPAFAGRLVLAGKGFARVYATDELAAGGMTAGRHGDVQLKLPGRERAVAQLSVGFLHGGS